MVNGNTKSLLLAMRYAHKAKNLIGWPKGAGEFWPKTAPILIGSGFTKKYERNLWGAIKRGGRKGGLGGIPPAPSPARFLAISSFS